MHAAVAQGQQERGVAREAVEFGDDEGCTGQAAQLDGFGQFRAVGILAPVDLGEPRQDLRTSGRRKPVDRIALRFQSQPAGALTRRRAPFVNEEWGDRRLCCRIRCYRADAPSCSQLPNLPLTNFQRKVRVREGARSWERLDPLRLTEGCVC